MRTLASFATLLIVIATAACTVQVEGNGVPAQEHRYVSAFHDIEVSDTLHAQVVVGQTQSVMVYGDQNLVSHIRTDVSGGYLFIDADVSYSTHMDLGVLITTPELYGVTARDVSTVEVDGIWTTTFSVLADDASSVRLSGYADDISVYVDGASDLDASALGTWTTWIDAYGASTVQVNATERVSGVVAGASTAYVYGRPLLIDAVVLDAAQIVIQ